MSYPRLVEMLELLPATRPFTGDESDDLGVGYGHRRLLIRAGLLCSRFPGVLHRPEIPDGPELRLAILSLVVPADCVVTDRTAAWLWVGDRALAPGDHIRPSRVSIFAPPGRRLRNGLADSGERRLTRADVVDVGGLQVTTPLRTACDLGRLLHRDQALAAMDAMADTKTFTVDQLIAELDRFKGYRGVVQARALAPVVDEDAQSQMESISRLRWLDAGLPRPRCQCPVQSPTGGSYYVDIGLVDEQFGVEFFGAEYHGPEREDHDQDRLEWLRTHGRWTIVVARTSNVVGPRQDLEETLRREWVLHRALTRRS